MQSELVGTNEQSSRVAVLIFAASLTEGGVFALSTRSSGSAPVAQAGDLSVVSSLPSATVSVDPGKAADAGGSDPLAPVAEAEPVVADLEGKVISVRFAGQNASVAASPCTARPRSPTIRPHTAAYGSTSRRWISSGAGPDADGHPDVGPHRGTIGIGPTQGTAEGDCHAVRTRACIS